MNLNQINYFITLAETEHYTNAAERLAITQPTLSHAISMLEGELGTELFEKRGRNVALTKHGKLFLKYASESLHLLDTGVKKTKMMNSRNSGVIDLAYIFTLGLEFVPCLVRDFLSENPGLDVRFKFTVGNTGEILDGLKNEKYDLAFCSRMEKESQVDFLAIGEENLVVVVPGSHPLAEKDEITLQEAAQYPQVFFTQDSGLRPTIEKLFEKAQIEPTIVYEIEEDSAMAGLVSKDFGIAVMPDIPILKYLDVKKLRITKPFIERYIYMARVKGRYQPPVVNQFMEYVIKAKGI